MKAFAYAMLDYAAPYQGQGKYNTLIYCKDSRKLILPGSNRALEAAFSIAMTCIGKSRSLLLSPISLARSSNILHIDNDCLSLSQKIIEVAAVRLDKLERYESDVENSKLQQYNIEYYMIRAHLVWSTRL